MRETGVLVFLLVLILVHEGKLSKRKITFYKGFFYAFSEREREIERTLTVKVPLENI